MALDAILCCLRHLCRELAGGEPPGLEVPAPCSLSYLSDLAALSIERNGGHAPWDAELIERLKGR